MTDIRMFSAPSQYTDGEAEMWHACLDAFNGEEFGFNKYRFPTPDRKIDLEKARKDVKRAEMEWEKEWQARDRLNSYTGPLKLTEMPEGAQLLFYENMEIFRARWSKRRQKSYGHWQSE